MLLPGVKCCLFLLTKLTLGVCRMAHVFDPMCWPKLLGHQKSAEKKISSRTIHVLRFLSLTSEIESQIQKWFIGILWIGPLMRSQFWTQNDMPQPKAHIVWKSPKMSHLNFSILGFFTNFWLIKTVWIFQFWHFPPIFVLLKLTCLVTLFDRKL